VMGVPAAAAPLACFSKTELAPTWESETQLEPAEPGCRASVSSASLTPFPQAEHGLATRLQLWLRGGEEDGAVGGEEVAEPVIEAVPPNPRKLYVGNLPLATQDAELKAFFESVGTVASIDLKRDKMGRCRCAKRALYHP